MRLRTLFTSRTEVNTYTSFTANKKTAVICPRQLVSILSFNTAGKFRNSSWAILGTKLITTNKISENEKGGAI